MWPVLMLHQSFQNQETEDILVQFSGTTLCFGREFHVTINLSKCLEPRKVVSAICIHLKSRQTGNVYVSISA